MADTQSLIKPSQEKGAGCWEWKKAGESRILVEDRQDERGLQLKCHLLRGDFPDPQPTLVLMLHILTAHFVFFLSIYQTVITPLFGNCFFTWLPGYLIWFFSYITGCLFSVSFACSSSSQPFNAGVVQDLVTLFSFYTPIEISSLKP